MKTSRSMARNATALLTSQAITWAATFVLTIYLPRSLGAAQYGKVQFLMTLMGMFAIAVDMGTSTLVTREVARDRAHAEKYLINTLVLKLLTGILAFVAFVVTVALMDRGPDMVRLAYVFGFGMLLVAGATLMNSILQGMEQIRYAALGAAVSKIVKTAVVIPIILHGFGLVPIAWGLVLPSFIYLLNSTYWVLRAIRFRPREFSFSFTRQVLTASMPFFLFAVFAKIYDKIDVTMLAMMTTDAVVGWYTAAYQLLETLFFLPFIFYTVAFPVLSRLWVQDAAAYRQAVHRGFALISAAGVGVSVPMFVLAGPIVELLYTQAEYPGTAPSLRVLSVALLSMHINTIFVMVLQSTDRQAQWTKAGALAALLNPAVNYLLIPPLGHLGAAATTVITEVMLLVMALRACPAGILNLTDARTFARSLAAGGVLAAGLLLGLRWGIPGALLLGFPLYLLATLRLGVLNSHDVALMRDAFLSRFSRS